MSDGLFRGAYLESDFASFTAWRHWGRPPAGVHDCFGAAAIRTRDGAFLLGVMGAHTVNAGQIYFPCGTPDLNDVRGHHIDLGASVARELKEETGCDMSEFIADPGWTMVRAGSLICQVKLLRAVETADALRTRIRAHLEREKQPELSDIRIVRSATDFDAAMPPFMKAYLEAFFASRQQ
jgi:8-oxo-dGTP pyrophosphatase MutT (NUDIX family)